VSLTKLTCRRVMRESRFEREMREIRGLHSFRPQPENPQRCTGRLLTAHLLTRVSSNDLFAIESGQDQIPAGAAQLLELQLVGVDSTFQDQRTGYVKYTARRAALSLWIQQDAFSHDLIRASA
jgi:hypothetical protein